MFPSHCKEVSVKTVDFELTAESIKGFLNGKRAYIRTRYYVFNSGKDWAVALIVKKLANGILQDSLVRSHPLPAMRYLVCGGPFTGSAFR